MFIDNFFLRLLSTFIDFEIGKDASVNRPRGKNTRKHNSDDAYRNSQIRHDDSSTDGSTWTRLLPVSSSATHRFRADEINTGRRKLSVHLSLSLSLRRPRSFDALFYRRIRRTVIAFLSLPPTSVCVHATQQHVAHGHEPRRRVPVVRAQRVCYTTF